MNTKELRIGNYVEVNGDIGRVVTISAVNEEHLEVSTTTDKIVNVKMSDVKPISLNDELLAKCCDFDKNGKHIIGIDDHRHALKIHEGYVIMLNKKNEDMIHFWDVQSLHRLQNLYFALKGTEMATTIS